jgi:hypothetical protein
MTLPSHCRSSLRAIAAMTLLVPAVGLGGCANMGDSMLSAFADPAKYEYFDCKQLEAERKSLANRSAELQGLMAKAETGTGGTVVGELAYRNDYISARAQRQIGAFTFQVGQCRQLERCRAKACPGPDLGWIPVRVKQMRQKQTERFRAKWIPVRIKKTRQK